MFNKLFTAATCAIGALANSTENGVNVSIDSSVFQQAETAYWPMIQERINAIEIPDLESKTDDRMYIKDNDFRVTIPSNHFNFFNEENCMTI